MRNRAITAPEPQSISKSAKGRTQIRRAEERRIELANQARGPSAHFGNHSVEGEGASDRNTTLVGNAVQQNVISYLRNRVYEPNYIVWPVDRINEVHVVGQVLRNARSLAPVAVEKRVPQGVSVSMRYGQKQGTLDDSLMSGFMIDKANYNIRAVAGALSSAIGIGNDVATTIATQSPLTIPLTVVLQPSKSEHVISAAVIETVEVTDSLSPCHTAVFELIVQ